MAFKNSIACLLLFLSFSGLYGQYFAPLGAEWHYAYAPIYCGYDCELLYYQASKDTSVAGRDARILEGWNYTHFGDTVYLGREIVASDSDRVYWWFDNQWRTLADFNSQPGDTVTVIPGTFSGMFFDQGFSNYEFRYVVDSVGTQLINGQNLRVLHTSSPNNGTLYYSLGPAFVERLGHGVGEFLASCPLGQSNTTILEYPGPIRCYSDSAFSYQSNPGMVCDTVILSALSPQAKVRVKVWPNPAKEAFYVEVEEDYRARLMDLQGKIVAEWQGEGNSPQKVRLDVEASGMYFLKVEGRYGHSVHKVWLLAD